MGQNFKPNPTRPFRPPAESLLVSWFKLTPPSICKYIELPIAVEWETPRSPYVPIVLGAMFVLWPDAGDDAVSGAVVAEPDPACVDPDVCTLPEPVPRPGLSTGFPAARAALSVAVANTAASVRAEINCVLVRSTSAIMFVPPASHVGSRALPRLQSDHAIDDGRVSHEAIRRIGFQSVLLGATDPPSAAVGRCHFHILLLTF